MIRLIDNANAFGNTYCNKNNNLGITSVSFAF